MTVLIVFKALITLFRAITLDNWSSVMYISVFGCDKYQDIYSTYPNQCKHPKASGAIAAIYFALFAIMGFQVLLSLFIGVITTSMDSAKERQDDDALMERELKKKAARLYLSAERVAASREVFNMLDLDGKFLKHVLMLMIIDFKLTSHPQIE